MTRIYDALKKAESNRQRLGLGPASLGGMPGHDPGAGWGHAQAEPTLTPLPLIGGVELTEDSIRETTGLRVNLESVLPDRNVRSVMFSSAQSGEGTTTVALQFAQTLAHSGARVLFVDANARRPACFAEDSHRFAVLDPRVGSMAMAGVMTPNLGAIPAPRGWEPQRAHLDGRDPVRARCGPRRVRLGRGRWPGGRRFAGRRFARRAGRWRGHGGPRGPGHAARRRPRGGDAAQVGWARAGHGAQPPHPRDPGVHLPPHLRAPFFVCAANARPTPDRPGRRASHPGTTAGARECFRARAPGALRAREPVRTGHGLRPFRHPDSRDRAGARMGGRRAARTAPRREPRHG